MNQIQINSSVYKNNIVEVRQIRKRTIKGSVNMKDILYKDMKEKIKKIDFHNLTDEDRDVLNRMQDIDKMKVSLTSFLPDEYVKELLKIQAKATYLFQEGCISPEVPYMTKSSWHIFVEEIKGLSEKCKAIVEDIITNWDSIKVRAAETVFNAAENNINLEEAEAIIKKRLPSIEKFKGSYENLFCYELKPLSQNVVLVDAENENMLKGDDYYIHEFKKILKNQALDAVDALDCLMFNKQISGLSFATEEKKSQRPRRRIKSCIALLEKIQKWINLDSFNDIISQLEKIAREDNDDILYEGCEILEYKLIKQLICNEIFEREMFPESIQYMNKEKFETLEKMIQATS